MEFHKDGVDGLFKDAILEQLRKVTDFHPNPKVIAAEVTDDTVSITVYENQMFNYETVAQAIADATGGNAWAGQLEDKQNYAKAESKGNPETMLLLLRGQAFTQTLRSELAKMAPQRGKVG